MKAKRKWKECNRIPLNDQTDEVWFKIDYDSDVDLINVYHWPRGVRRMQMVRGVVPYKVRQMRIKKGSFDWREKTYICAGEWFEGRVRR